ncbi:hypothetical protein Sme01_20590 [Sphaerisporangium melleum]|uniref:Acyl-CoA dehydrogenase C-terminal domain-containing protein n=2 Tax=Sphaerisporangium melleum TaxID=321316 RepID=A0A917RL62_9ACTN|nr:hypothetical protein GCM10007964_63580 [Sphaerisporangium melleum]GII69583.1 hypothetical protein Sme01_20590 [Sphaerisporangium melleum]
MSARLRVAKWALLAAVAEAGEDPAADERTLTTLMVAKRHAVCEANAIVDLALEVVGGSAFFRRSPLDRAYRDVRAGRFHPINPEATLALAGATALAEARLTTWEGVRYRTARPRSSLRSALRRSPLPA